MFTRLDAATGAGIAFPYPFGYPIVNKVLVDWAKSSSHVVIAAPGVRERSHIGNTCIRQGVNTSGFYLGNQLTREAHGIKGAVHRVHSHVDFTNRVVADVEQICPGFRER